MHTLIVCGGTPPTRKLLESEIAQADITIGADSGGYVFLGFKHLPDVVIGDMDSFKYTNHEGVNVIEDSDQETNDLEKALSYALENGAKTTTVLGAFGKRIDHTLKNLSVLQQFHERFEQIIYRDDYGDTFLVKSPYLPKLTPGTVISFFPLGKPVTCFTSTGVLYPLKNSTLDMGVQDGTSNEITSKDAQITFDSEYLGIFIGSGDKIKKQKRD